MAFDKSNRVRLLGVATSVCLASPGAVVLSANPTWRLASTNAHGTLLDRTSGGATIVRIANRYAVEPEPSEPAAVRTPPEWLRELLKLRERAIGEGMPLLSANEINEEVAQRRGFR